MIFITHAVFGILLASGAQAGYAPSIACATGALLPDLDSPQSFIGKPFFFLSIPLNNRFEHRKLIHSFALWTPLLIVGLLLHSPTMQWFALGALSHVLLDCYNVAGVQAFLPFSEKTVVCFKRDWRILSGSRADIVLCLIFLGLIGASQYAASIGGWRKLTNLVIQSPQITLEEFRRAGNLRCSAKGVYRYADSRIEEVNWLVVGSEGVFVAYWNGERILHHADGDFLSSVLACEQGHDWPLIKVNGILTVTQDVFYFDQQKWRVARAGQKAYGTVKTINGDYPEVEIK